MRELQMVIFLLLFLGSIAVFLISCMVGLSYGSENEIGWVITLRASEATFVISLIGMIWTAIKYGL